MTSTVTKSVPGNNSVAGYHYTYNALDQRERVEHADATYWDYNYDTLGQVTSGKKKLPGGQQLNGYDFGYSFDGIGNRITASANGNTQQYSANGLNQYTQRTVPGAVDVVGEADPAASVKINSQPSPRQGDYFHGQVNTNNTSTPQYPLVTVTAEKGTSTTTKSGNVYVPKTPEEYTYDLDGNMLSDGRWNYTWDCENRLIMMESLATVPAEARRKITYHYDYMSRRIAKRVDTWNVSTSSWNTGELHTFYHDGWNLYAEVTPDAAEDVIKGEYVWGLDLSGSLQGAGGVGGLLSVQTDSGGGVVISDGNGNVTKLVRPWASIPNYIETAADYEYGPFGELIRMTGPQAKANPFRFSTKYQEAESGLLYYGTRYYNSSIGRWCSRDWIAEYGGVNLYGFINNNTINNVDLLGFVECYCNSNSLEAAIAAYFVLGTEFKISVGMESCVCCGCEKGGTFEVFAKGSWDSGLGIGLSFEPFFSATIKGPQFRREFSLSTGVGCDGRFRIGRTKLDMKGRFGGSGGFKYAGWGGTFSANIDYGAYIQMTLYYNQLTYKPERGYYDEEILVSLVMAGLNMNFFKRTHLVQGVGEEQILADWTEKIPSWLVDHFKD